MKKLSKLMALLLSISMILSLFAACGDDKKTADNNKNNDNASVSDEKDAGSQGGKGSAKDVLIGEWETKVEFESISINLSLVFENDGTAYFNLSEKNFNKLIDEIVKIKMEGITDEEIAAEGLASRKDAEAFVKEALLEEFTYESFVETYVPKDKATWKLDGNKLTVESKNIGVSTAKTKLSKGKTTFTLINEGSGEEQEFTKVK